MEVQFATSFEATWIRFAVASEVVGQSSECVVHSYSWDVIVTTHSAVHYVSCPTIDYKSLKNLWLAVVQPT